MDNDRLRRGKLSTHAKFGESTAILAGNSLLTIAFEILSQPTLKIDYKSKINLISLLSKSAGHTGIAGGQYSDLKYEKKRKSFKKIVDMQINKTGKLFSFCCMAPVILSKKNKYLNLFNSIGSKIGLLFQIADDLIDYSGSTKKAGKKTRKDSKKGKASSGGSSSAIIHPSSRSLSAAKPTRSTKLFPTHRASDEEKPTSPSPPSNKKTKY